MAKTLFEYLVKDKDGEEYILTEKQREFLLENESKRFISIRDVDLNPAYIVAIRKRPAEALKRMYPCNACTMNGYLIGQPRDDDGKYPECPDCEGTGVKLP